MEAMLKTYTTAFPTHTSKGKAAASSVDEIVLLTGTTGRLGAHLLAQLLERKSVSKVYALDRPGAESQEDRQRKAFESWGLDLRLLSSGKLIPVETDCSKKDLGVGKALFNEVCDPIRSSSLVHLTQLDDIHRCGIQSRALFTMVSTTYRCLSLDYN